MSKLMDELMKEIERVNNLEVEVKRAVEKSDGEVKIARREKLKKIEEFLKPMQKILCDAGLSGKYIKTDIYAYDGCLRHNIEIEFNDDSIVAHKFGTYYYAHINGAVEGKIMPVLIDEWSNGTERMIEAEVTNSVKEEIARRITKATNSLKASNDKHDKYYKGE